MENLECFSITHRKLLLKYLNYTIIMFTIYALDVLISSSNVEENVEESYVIASYYNLLDKLPPPIILDLYYTNF